jgi:hypothetical protein
MQQEAESSGWFWVEPEFSRWYPWFRLRFRLSVNLPEGNPDIDSGWSPLPFGQSYCANDTVIANVMNNATGESDPLAIVDLVIGSLAQILAFLALGRTPTAIVTVTIFYIIWSGARTVQLLFTAGSPKAWLLAFISTLIGVSGGLALGGLLNMGSFLTAVSRKIVSMIAGKTYTLVAGMRGFGLNFFDITGLAMAFIDFAFMAFHISMYLKAIGVI